MARNRTLLANLTPRGVSREEAAAYVGLGPTLFDRMVREGLMPSPKTLGGRKVWDVRALDRNFDAVPEGEAANPWDSAT